MKKMITLLAAIPMLAACHSNPYDGVGPVQTPNTVQETKPQAIFQLIGNNNINGEEGAELVQKFQIIDNQNPQGPFRIYLSHVPAGTTHLQTSPTEFEVHFQPGYTFVKGQNSRTVNLQLHVINPDNKILDQDLTWIIANNTLAPMIEGPVAINATAGSTLCFTLLASDMNGEEYPHFSILSSPQGASIVGTETLLSSNGDASQELLIHYPSTQYTVTWSNVPVALVGQLVPLSIQSCSNTYQKCSTQNIQVKVLPSQP